MKNNIKNKRLKRNLILSIAVLMISCLLLGVSYAWFYVQRDMSTVAWVNTPIELRIGAGKDQDIVYLDMGDIDVESNKDGYKEYLINVWGKPVDNYLLQLAYTTNIPFHYDVYRADENGNYNSSDRVIEGFSMKEIIDKGEDPAKYQSHNLSYDGVEKERVQAYNEPLYFLAEESINNETVSVMRPRVNPGAKEFRDYYVIRVSWTPGEVSNDKETDIVYLTASR